MKTTKILSYFILISAIALLTNCRTNLDNTDKRGFFIPNPLATDKWDKEYNVEIIIEEDGFGESGKQAPQDSLGFFRINIDKMREERTPVALRSQKRIWRGKLSLERHLISLERWELSTATETYQLSRNLLQPKPKQFYIEMKKDKLTRVIMRASANGTKYTLEKSHYPEDKMLTN